MQAYNVAAAAGVSGIQLRTTGDEQAHLFWKSLGFRQVEESSNKGQGNTYCLQLKQAS